MSHFKVLSCSHKVCSSCYLRLEKSTCPICRKSFNYSVEDLNKRRELGIENKYNSPSVQQNYIERTRINDFSTLHNSRLRNNNRNVNEEFEEGIGIMGRQRFRKRRRNLSEEEVKEKRKIIREKCRRKWSHKENRLRKVNWYDIEVN